MTARSTRGSPPRHGKIVPNQARHADHCDVIEGRTSSQQIDRPCDTSTLQHRYVERMGHAKRQQQFVVCKSSLHLDRPVGTKDTAFTKYPLSPICVQQTLHSAAGVVLFIGRIQPAHNFAVPVHFQESEQLEWNLGDEALVERTPFDR